jgi:dihydroorotase
MLLAHGIQPDIISSDLHAVSVNGPAYDLPTTMSKMLMLGMPLRDVIHAVTAQPASVLGLEQELGTLALETAADITILEQEQGEFDFQDCFGNTRSSDTRLKPTDLIFGGRVICRSGARPS